MSPSSAFKRGMARAMSETFAYHLAAAAETLGAKRRYVVTHAALDSEVLISAWAGDRGQTHVVRVPIPYGTCRWMVRDLAREALKHLLRSLGEQAD